VLPLVKEVEIIGEAAHQLPDKTRSSLPDMPWEDIIGMRHRLVHAYFDINLDIVWRTVGEDLPAWYRFSRPESLRSGYDGSCIVGMGGAAHTSLSGMHPLLGCLAMPAHQLRDAPTPRAFAWPPHLP